MASPDDPSIQITTSTGEIKNIFTFPKKLLGKSQIPLALDVLSKDQVVIGAAEQDGDLYSLTKKKSSTSSCSK